MDIARVGLLASALVAFAPQDPAKSPAAQLLEQAEAAAAKGQYGRAIALYKQLARDFAQSPEGAIGERRSQKNAFLGWDWLGRTGPSANRVDVVVMGEGFRVDQMSDYDTLAKMVPREFPRTEVFEEYAAYLNFVRAAIVSEDDGVDGSGRDYSTALGAMGSGGIQGQVTVQRDAVHRMLTELPEHDGFAIVLVKNGLLGTGGNGVAAVGGRDPKTLIHEWGHAFANLMDEYSANTGHRVDVRGGPNVSFVEDEKRVPWAHWLAEHVSGIGVHEGANGRAQGAWKPTNNCIMDVGQEFCPVCREAIVLQIHRLVDPIDEATPDAHATVDSAIVLSAKTPLREQKPLTFRVKTLRPKSHPLQATWFVVRDDPGRPTIVPARTPDRLARGPLPRLDGKPRQDGKANGGVDAFVFEQEDYEPGLWRVVVRVQDSTRVRGDRTPWVLKDDAMLLVTERSWWIRIDP
ncbi:MAG: hypothetical protein JNL94_19460 [Planctomycetes bacterium]|nr:hypothetical protein [Planctomycetota bacterium]